jgi:hypothetical protein
VSKLRLMVSMELDDEDKLDSIMPIEMPSKPDFPWGLRICLTEAEFEKLKLDPTDAEVGGIFHMHGLARITSVSHTEGENGKCCRVEATIEDLAIESEDEENEKD